MSIKLTLEQIIAAWKLNWGGRFPIDHGDRIQEFQNFFESAKQYGYADAEYYNNSTKEKIVAATYNPKHKIKENLATWKEINQGLFDQAFVDYFNLVEIKEAPVKERKEKNYKPVAKKENTTYDKIGTDDDYFPSTEPVKRKELDTSKIKPLPELPPDLSSEELEAQLKREFNE